MGALSSRSLVFWFETSCNYILKHYFYRFGVWNSPRLIKIYSIWLKLSNLKKADTAVKAKDAAIKVKMKAEMKLKEAA